MSDPHSHVAAKYMNEYDHIDDPHMSSHTTRDQYDNMDFLARVRDRARSVEEGSPKTGTPEQAITPFVQEGSVELSKDALDRIDAQVEHLFSLQIHSPEWVKFTDLFHRRAPVNTTAMLEDDEASNASLAMTMLNDLRVMLNSMFTEDRVDGKFREKLDKVRKPINNILKQLGYGKHYITNDLTSIDEKAQSFYDGLTKLRRSIVVATALRQRIEKRANASSEQIKAAVLENVVFYLAQREIDLMTELAVTTQSYLAMKTIRKTNVILNQNIDRILTITVQALNNAIFVATNIDASALDYVFDTKKFVLGFEGKQVRDMISGFYSLDKDLLQIEEQVKEAKLPPKVYPNEAISGMQNSVAKNLPFTQSMNPFLTSQYIGTKGPDGGSAF